MGILRRHASFLNFLRRSLDIVIVVATAALVGRMYGPPELTRALAIYGSLLTIFYFSYLDLYRSFRQQTLFDQLRQLFLGWSCVVISFNIIILLLANPQQLEVLWPVTLFGAPVFQMWIIVGFISLSAARIIISGFLYYIRKKGYNNRSVAIVGSGRIARQLGKHLSENNWLGLRLAGYFDDHGASAGPLTGECDTRLKILGPVSECTEVAARLKLDMVFIALPMRAEKEIKKLARSLGTSGITVLVAADLFTIGVHRAKIHYMGNLPLMDINLFPTWKRSFDLVFSTLVILLTLPLWLLILLLIKIEDRGPVLYGHTRVAESGKRFKCLKFRTMHLNADQKLKALLENNKALQEEWESSYKLKNDPRVTRVGRFLRKTSLDELPQFINVLCGDMSVVGARPIVSEELDKYYKDVALTYCSMKPGITGPWQVGQRSDTVDYDQRVEQDRCYVLSCNLWLDIRIILKTIWRVARPKGAY